MIIVNKLRNGTNFELDGQPYRVLDFKHTHMSRGGGTVRVKVRNIMDGSVLVKSFKSTEKVEEIDVSKRLFQYLYQDGKSFLFMNPTTFEQIEVASEVIAESAPYLIEGNEVHILYWQRADEDVVLGVELPPKMEFVITEAAPGERGDSASNVYKDAVLSNGLKVRVPLFVNEGDMVRVDTRTGEYVERA